MLTLCLYDLIYLITSVLMFAVPLLYPLVVMNMAFTFSVPFLLPIAQTAMTGMNIVVNYCEYYVILIFRALDKAPKIKEILVV